MALCKKQKTLSNMKSIISIFFFLTLWSASSSQSTDQFSDSIKRYQAEISKISKGYRDSLLNNPEYKALSEKIRSLNSLSDNYTAFMLFTSVYSIDFKKFNSDLFQSGFNPFSGNMISIGIGFSTKKKRRIFDIDILAIGLRKKITKADEKITINSSTFFQMTWGYDFVKSGKINIYPFVGLGLAGLEINYESPTQVNSSFTDISNIVINNRSARGTSIPLCYKAGIGVEYALINKRKSGGTIFFVKGGTTQPFRKKAFDIEGVEYDPKFNFGALTFTAGFKFFGR